MTPKRMGILGRGFRRGALATEAFLQDQSVTSEREILSCPPQSLLSGTNLFPGVEDGIAHPSKKPGIFPSTED